MNRTAIITGGGQGIGKAVAKEFLAHGASVVLAEIDSEAGEEAAAELGSPEKVIFIETDVSNEESVSAMVSATVEKFGGIDLLVNNAALGAGAKVTELSLSDWNRVIATNLTGPFLCAKHTAPHIAKRRGSIINIASTRALMSEPNTTAYSASKGGVVALTHSLAVSLGPEIRVNCISPGWIETGPHKKASKKSEPHHSEEDKSQHPCGRVGIPGDIASAIMFLADEKNGFITGQNFVIDGGMTKRMQYI